MSSRGDAPATMCTSSPIVQWCDTNLSWSVAPTPSSHAFVLKSDGVALSVGRMGP